jgi:GMP synthase (glutamine-hydrolysing)
VQLIAKAEGAGVYPLPDGAEIGWVPVELTEAAASDPVFARLPERFDSFNWHYYTYDVPAGAVELARSASCNQAFRLGEAAWGIQFHAEATLETIRLWLADEDELPGVMDRAALAAETEERIGEWNDLGRELCGSFIEVAERAAVPA